MNIAMNIYLVLATSLLFPGAFQYESPRRSLPISINDPQCKLDEYYCTNKCVMQNLREEHCTSTFNGDVNTYELKDGSSDLGKTIWMSRKSGRAKAKYFAHKYGGNDVHDRYTKWRVGETKDIILKSSGAYATGWNNSHKPVGVTVDNGIIVNKKYHEKMDGLVIVYATGGIVVSNIEDGNFFVESINRRLNIKDENDKVTFLTWATRENATAFQMHLMAYENSIRIGKYNSSDKRARRKFLTLARSSSGELFHIIFYLKNKSYTLYNATELVFNYLKHTKNMEVVAMINLDTGGYDILNTANDVMDCNRDNVWGISKNYEDMTNLLSYHYE